MSEYIITCDDEVAMWVGNDVESMKKIVRCRDCVWFCEANELFATDDWCKNFGCEVEPDGFCKWGGPRKNEQG